MSDPCKKEEIIAEMKAEHKALSDRIHNSDVKFQEVQDGIGGIASDIKSLKINISNIERRLFVNNGTPSIQTLVDRNVQIIKGLIWTISLVVATIIPLVILAIARTVSNFSGSI